MNEGTEVRNITIKPRGVKFRLNKNGIYEYQLLKESIDPDLNDTFQEATSNGTISEKFDVVDLHSHTNLTDGVLSPEELVDNAIANGITVLAVTDHNCTASALAAKQYAERRYPEQIKIILGIELATESGHLLVYFNGEESMRQTEETFPFVQYVNKHTDKMQGDYRAYYRDFMRDAPPADSLKVSLEKLKQIDGVTTSMAHPFAGTKLLAEIARKRGLTSLGGLMAHPEWDESLSSEVDIFEAHNDFSPVGNAKAHQHFSRNSIPNISTGSDSRIADPQTLTLAKKDEDPFEAIRKGRTIFIQRGKNKVDKYYDRVVQWQAWLGDYYMSEVKRGEVVKEPGKILSAIQGIQLKIRRCLYGKAHQKWEKIQAERTK